MKSFENSYSSFYDLLYHDKNYKKEFNNIYKFIPKKDFTFNKILELGCGTGNFSNFFLSFKPSEILGIDSSKSMIQIAKNKQIGTNFLTLLTIGNLFSIENIHYFLESRR